MNFRRRNGIKKLWAFLLSLIIIGSFALPVSAASNELHSITTTININNDGSADIVEVWNIKVVEGTEIYKQMKNMDGSPITDFTVVSNDIVFEAQDSWDVNASIEEKAFKSGIIKDGNDYELCFGVGDYGEHLFTMYYSIDNFVQEYADMFGMNYQLIGSDMNVKPKEMSIKIYSEQINANTKIFGFGFEGYINIMNQGDTYFIDANNSNDDGSFGTVNYANVLAGFEGASFSSANDKHSGRTFEDMADEAKDGSDYYDDSNGTLTVIWMILTFAVVAIFFAYLIIGSLRQKKYGYMGNLRFTDGTNAKSLPKKTEVDYFRDIPANKDIFLFSYTAEKALLVEQRQRETGLFSGILLNWIRNKNIEFVILENQGGLLRKDSHRIQFLDDSTLKTPMEKELYGYLKLAAGADGILEDREFEKWCDKNYTKMRKWFKDVKLGVESMMKTNGYADDRLVYTDKFKETILQSVGFKRFLSEFASMGEKQAKEVVLWEEYLMFASVLGMADKVEKEIGRIYPEFKDNSYIDPTFTVMATNTFALRSMNSVSTAASRASGGGGSSSFGGGGSSFSGGGGGGVR
ncbi:MAG: DUF2207 family protein [Suipraeoptans sp.]